MLAKRIHQVLGISLLVAYVFMLSNIEALYPMLIIDPDFSKYRSIRGVNVAMALPALSIFCFLLPTIMTEKFSPRYGLFQKPILTPGFWYIVGWLNLPVSYGVLQLFK